MEGFTYEGKSMPFYFLETSDWKNNIPDLYD
jgi:hypothetical protein